MHSRGHDWMSDGSNARYRPPREDAVRTAAQTPHEEPSHATWPSATLFHYTTYGKLVCRSECKKLRPIYYLFPHNIGQGDCERPIDMRMTGWCGASDRPLTS